jgi:uncharacterized membrane protein
MFFTWMGLGGLVAAARIVEWRLLGHLVSNPFAVTSEQAQAAYDRSLRLGIVALVAYVITGILFIVWLHRSYRNLLAFGLNSTRFPEGWAIGAWFVPILNLWRPKQIVDECWEESGFTPADGGRDRRRARVPALVHWWWGLMIASRVFSSAFWMGDLADLRELRFWAGWLSVGAVLEVITAAAAFWLVTRLTRRQGERASRLGLDRPPRRAPRPAAAAVAAVLPLAAAAATVPAFLAWDEPPAFAVIQAEPGQAQGYDAYGVSFEYRAGYLAAESSGFGSGPPSNEFGMVALTPEDPDHQDHYIVVEWASELTAADAVDMIDAVVDMITWTESGVPLVTSSEVTYLPFGSGEFAARSFSATEGGAWVSGAVGYGMCPSGDRLAGIRYIYPASNRQGIALDNLAGVLATLSC